MNNDELSVLRETTALLLAHSEQNHTILTEVRDEVRKQGATIVEIRLEQSKTKQLFEHGSKEMQSIRAERAMCEVRCKAEVNRAVLEAARELAETKKDTLHELGEMKIQVIKDLAAVQNGMVKKTDILSGLWQLFLASGLSAVVVAVLAAAYLKTKGC